MKDLMRRVRYWATRLLGTWFPILMLMATVFFIVSMSPNDLFVFKYWVIVFWIIVGLFVLSLILISILRHDQKENEEKLLAERENDVKDVKQ